MIRYLLILLVGMACSMYIFPFQFTFFPIGNTKIYMAVLGMILFGLNSIFYRRQDSSRAMVNISLAALGVSLAGVFSLLINGTNDYTYTQYIILMWVWVGAAYFVVKCMKGIHGNITVELLGSYFIGVCVAQCCFALLNDFVPDFKFLVDTYVEQETDFLNKVERMYGIGASLDTAGSRFACALIILSYLTVKYAKYVGNNSRILFLVFLFIFVFVIGNMVARTTIVGALIAIGYFLYSLNEGFKNYHRQILYSFIFLLFLTVPLLTYLYMVSPDVKELLTFSFESFFNLAEKGKLETHSTNELLDMWTHIPSHLKTWIIGDGYFLNPISYDPYYTGEHRWFYYMGTDVGYLRFIFYFGLVGLALFINFFICCLRESKKKYNNDQVLFVLLFIMGLVLWAKVSTDLFFLFALFLLADYDCTEDKFAFKQLSEEK